MGSVPGLDERKQRILEYVTSAGFATPEELAGPNRVAAITIRRDLIKLESLGLVRRVHGGAVPCDAPFAISHVAGRMRTFPGRKRAIAVAAASLVRPGDRVFVDAGSSCRFLAEALPEDRDVTVITHSLDVVTALSGRSGIGVVSLGGELDTRLNAFVGSMTEAALGSFHVSKAFIGTNGVDLDAGLSINSLTEERIKTLMVEHAVETYALADSSKFGVAGLRAVMPLSAVTAIITDAGVDARRVRALRKAGVKVQVARAGARGAK